MAFFVFLTTTFLLFPVVQSQSCAPAGYTISTLTSPLFWLFEADPSYCANSKLQSSGAYGTDDGIQAIITNTTTNTSNCMIIFSVCKQLPLLCPNQAVCKIKGMTPAFQYITWPVNLGSMEYEGFKFGTGDKSISIEYHNGDKMSCNGKQQPLKTRITFNCDEHTKWNATAKTGMPFAGGAKTPSGTILFSITECMYKISFNSSEACPNHSPVAPALSGNRLSTGSILLILFFPSVFLYCIVGGLINAGRKKSGTDLIPNYSFWKDLPYLVLDGFGFVIAILTCSKVTTTTPKPTSYQSM